MNDKLFWETDLSLDSGTWKEHTNQENASLSFSDSEYFIACEKPENRKKTGVRVSFLPADGKMTSLELPVYAEGRTYFFTKKENELSQLLYMEAVDGEWVLRSQKPCFFRDRFGKISYSAVITGNDLLKVENFRPDGYVFAEIMYEENQVFRNYQVSRFADIRIGSTVDNDIVCTGESMDHQDVVLRGGSPCWKIESAGSALVFINGIRKNTGALKPGDRIFLPGLRIIIGMDFISLNSTHDRVYLKRSRLKPVDSARSVVIAEVPMQENPEKELFNRSPRRRMPLITPDISIEMPPMPLSANGIPLMLRMGSPMVMASMGMIAGNFTSMLSSVLFPVLTQKYTDKQKAEYEEKRQVVYNIYLNEKENEIREEKKKEETILNHNYPPLRDILNYSLDEKEHLWERRNTDDDFLSLRLGYGDRPLISNISYQKERFVIEEDNLTAKMYELAKKPVFLHDVPIMLSLVEDTVCGVLGPQDVRLQFIRNLIMQIALLHSYDEVKMIVLGDDESLRELEFVRYLPHVWNDQKDFRFLAADNNEAYQISEYLKREIENDIDNPKELSVLLKDRPYYVVIALNKKIFDSMEIIKDVMKQPKNCGVSILSVYDDIPKECTKIVNLSDTDHNTVTHLKTIEHEDEVFRIDRIDHEKAERSMKSVCNIDLKVVSQAYSLPKTVTFLEMYGVGKAEHLNPLKRWKESNPVKSLAVPVGVSTDGSLFNLDLHQKYQGPHGLVAGMTGSGKSEFLLTYILSLAINFHPEEAAFILIDYKGGGLAGAFDNPAKGIHLPHLIGTITNLDGSTIQRSVAAIQSEMTRRQRVFNEAKAKTDEGTMDIYTYQNLYRNHVVDEPMPHLFIISDEFAELKQQQPDFMDQLISIARIGRSLGVHLILATQKPAGIVNDQIRSNTKFRVCLKVQDKMDSRDMLLREEAAELKETGRFYLQVGYNEYFALGQSAWSGAPYVPREEVIVNKDDSIEVIDAVGSDIAAVRKKEELPDAQGSQLVSIVSMLSRIAKENNIHIDQLLPPELPKKFDIQKLQEEYEEESTSIDTCIGLLDDPENQAQYPLNIDFIRNKHILITGEQGSGKTMIVNDILLSVIRKYSPEQVQFYVLDYSSRILKMYEDLPHCGAVLYEEDLASLNGFFDIINGIVSERKKLFTELEVDNFEAARQIYPMPLILVVIDNITGMGGEKGSSGYLMELNVNLKNAASYGVNYILTASHMDEVSVRLRQEIGLNICLHMRDRYDYMSALKCRVNFEPSARPGRGLFNWQDRPLEYQAGMYFPDLEGREWTDAVKDMIDSCRQKYADGPEAVHLPVIEEDAEYRDFVKQFKQKRIPLGFSKTDGKPVALPLKQMNVLNLYFGNKNGIRPIIHNFILAADREKMQKWIVRRKKKTVFDETFEYADKEHTKIFDPEESQLQAMWKELAAEMNLRNLALKEYCEKNNIEMTADDFVSRTFTFMQQNMQPILIFIENFYDFAEALDTVSTFVFDEIFKLTRKRNIYLIPCYYPEDADRKLISILMSSVNHDHVILFGGQFNSQKICATPFDDSQISDRIAFNLGLMYYMGTFHPLLMPCGIVEKEEADEDEKNIF